MKTVIITIPPLSFKTRLLLALHDVRCVHESSKSVNTEKMVISFNILFPSNDNIPLLCRQNAIVVPVRGKLTTVIFYV